MATDEALKRKLIARTARVWGRLNKRLVKELNEITQEWIKKLIWHAEREIASGDISNVPEFPEKFTEILQQGLREAFAYGYWLQELYLYERRGRKYKGKITLAEGDNVKDLLEDFMSTGEWNDIVPEDAVNWIRNYVPKLAGVLNQDSLELTSHILMTSMQQGLTLQERMKALREYVPEISEMAKHRIEAIARTEITRADSLGRIASAKQNEDAIGFEFSAIMDDRTTEICASRHGLVMRIDDPRLAENTPPLHVRCRSVLLILTIYDYPDGLLTSHEFDEIPHSMQRPEDIEEVEKLLYAEMQHIKQEIVELSPEVEKIKPTAEYLQEYEQLRAEIKEELKKDGVYISKSDEMLVEQKLKDFLISDETHIGIRFSMENFDSIFVDSGRFKSLFETHTAGGAHNEDWRSTQEYNQMSYAKDMPAHERPIYGMLFNYKNPSEVPKDAPGWFYGETIAIFKQDIKKYATFAGGDTLDEQDNYIIPSPILNPSIKSVLNYTTCLKQVIEKSRENSKLSFNDFLYHDQNIKDNYVEVQIHGGHAIINNIERLIFPEWIEEHEIPKDILTKYNIKWSKIGEKIND